MYWYDGRLIHADTISLAIADPGLLYGATVFTTLRVWEQSLVHPLSFWPDHCDRLSRSLQYLGWHEPNWQLLRQGAEVLACHYPILRLTVFADGREWITGRPLPENLAQWQRKGVTAWVAPDVWLRSLPGHKTGNYLICWLALQQAKNHGCQEAILTDDQGNWLETTTGNLWGWYDNCWWTPALREISTVEVREKEQILPGIGRSHLITALKWHNMRMQECTWSPELVKNLEAVVYSNSVRHIVPINQIHPRNGESEQPLRFQPSHPEVHTIAKLFRSAKECP